MYLPGPSGLLDVQPIGLGDWVTVAAIAVWLILVMDAYKGPFARRLEAR